MYIKVGFIFSVPTFMEKKLGVVTHYYAHVPAVVIKLEEGVKIGDRLHFVGHGIDVVEPVESLEVDRKPVTQGKKDGEVAMKVTNKIKGGTEVYLAQG